MPGLSAVVFIPDDTAKTGYSRPMMLQNIMGTPLLSWLASSLIAGGVGRFFMVCHERFRRDVRACIPDDVGFFCPAQEAVSDQLHVFLSTADESEEDVIVVTGPAVRLLTERDSDQARKAENLLEKGISIQACRHAMQIYKVNENEMWPNIEFVRSGVVALVQLQDEGMAYVKP